MEAVAAYDTAGSVKLVLDSDHEAAIAGADAAALYDAEILAANIEDHPENYTRFVLLGASPDDFPGPRKTTVLFRTPNTPGALFRALAAFALRDINLTKLESRPIEGRPWEYAFYADLTGASDERPIANAIAHLREMCDVVTLLGSYAAVE